MTSALQQDPIAERPLADVTAKLNRLGARSESVTVNGSDITHLVRRLRIDSAAGDITAAELELFADVDLDAVAQLSVYLAPAIHALADVDPAVRLAHLRVYATAVLLHEPETEGRNKAVSDLVRACLVASDE